MKLQTKHIWIGMTIALCTAAISGCKKFLDIPLPTDKFAIEGAYLNDNSAGAVLTGIFSTAASSQVYGSFQNYESIGYRTGLYSDDLTLIQAASANGAAAASAQFYTNALSSANSVHWGVLYKQLYNCNLTIENLNTFRGNLSRYNQWMGEALFMRAFTYFDLDNLYGDIPLTSATSYETNNQLLRSPRPQVYAQIISDLKQAEALLGTTYIDGLSNPSANRARPNQFVAAALLARVYLYTGDNANAELEATKVISNTSLYQLLAPSAVFLANSRETIWALAPPVTTAVRDYFLYNNGAAAVQPSQAALSTFAIASISQSLVNAFEPGDLRFSTWTTLRTTTAAPVAGQFYFPAKYKSSVNGTEFNVVLRLAEQYLIRAEARAKQNNVSGCAQDLNLIRQRSRPALPVGALADYPLNMTQQACIDAVVKERRVELFSEFGHRFYDLKRLGLIDALMTTYAPIKGGTWASFKQLWPIPAADVQLNPALGQTPGFN
jgi:hypothetical protein